jgi:hypothetical protein
METDMSDPKEHSAAPARVSTLRQLRGGFEPSRDLWPQIENRIVSRQPDAGPSEHIDRVRDPAPRGWLRLAAAAMLLVAFGIWIGRGEQTQRLLRTGSETATVLPPPTAGCVGDAQFQRERTALLSAPAASLAGLPPDSRQRILASLTTIHSAVQDIETALARDATNPLLQDLLLTTCQDETRVLTEVQVAGAAERAGRGI